MSRLPEPGKDIGTWGIVLNDYLNQSHNADGSIKNNVVTPAALAGNIPQTKIINLEADISSKANTSDLAPVAMSGVYTDLTDKPAIPDIAGLIPLTSIDTDAAMTANSTTKVPSQSAVVTALATKTEKTYVDTQIALIPQPNRIYSTLPYQCVDSTKSIMVSLSPTVDVSTISVTNSSENILNPQDLIAAFPTVISTYGNGVKIVGTNVAKYTHKDLIKQLEPNTSYYFSAISSNNSGYGCGLTIYDGTTTTGTLLLNNGNSDNPHGLFTTGSTGICLFVFYLLANAATATLASVEAHFTDINLKKSTTVKSYTVCNAITKTAAGLVAGQIYQLTFDMGLNDTLDFSVGSCDYTLQNPTNDDAVLTIDGVTPDVNRNININKAQFTGKKIAMFGDSNIGNFQTDGIPLLLQNIIGGAIYNVGFGATRMSTHPSAEYDAFCMHSLADSIETGDWTLQDSEISLVSTSLAPSLPTIKAIDWATIDYVAICHGSNDWTNSTTKLDNLSNLIDYTSFKGGFRYFYAKLLAKNPKIKVILMTSPFRGIASPQTETCDTLAMTHGADSYYLYQFIDATYELAKEFKLPLLDLFYDGNINSTNWAQYLSDGAHYTLESRQIVARRLAEAVKGYF